MSNIFVLTNRETVHHPIDEVNPSHIPNQPTSRPTNHPPEAPRRISRRNGHTNHKRGGYRGGRRRRRKATAGGGQRRRTRLATKTENRKRLARTQKTENDKQQNRKQQTASNKNAKHRKRLATKQNTENYVKHWIWIHKTTTHKVKIRIPEESGQKMQVKSTSNCNKYKYWILSFFEREEPGQSSRPPTFFVFESNEMYSLTHLRSSPHSLWCTRTGWCEGRAAWCSVGRCGATSAVDGAHSPLWVHRVQIDMLMCWGELEHVLGQRSLALAVLSEE